MIALMSGAACFNYYPLVNVSAAETVLMVI